MSASKAETVRNCRDSHGRWQGRRFLKKIRNKAIRRAFKRDGEDADTKGIKGWAD